MLFRSWLLLTLLIPILSVGQADGTPSTIQVPGDFPRIQLAIDSAGAGDTVRVAAGIYRETVVVNKTIHLIGQSKETTVIDGGGTSPVVLVNATNVEIKGFTIRNALSYGSGVFLTENAFSVTVRDNTVSAAPDGDGVTIQHSNNNTVTGNNFSGNLYAVNATDSEHNRVMKNILDTNTVGVQLWNSRNNVVANNTLRKGETGLFLYQAGQNFLVRNVVIKGSIAGIHLVDSPGNTVIENSFEFNKIGIDVQDSRNNVFYHNNIISSTLSQVTFVNNADRPFTRWDNGTRGNYWDDYEGLDDGSGGGVPGDGVGDTFLPADGVDNYPLMAPFAPLAFAVRAVASISKGPAPLAVTFSVNVVGGLSPFTYDWDFGDGTVGVGFPSSHRYTIPGSYAVRLEASDYAGTLDEDTITITVDSPAPAQSSYLSFLAAGMVATGGVGAGFLVWRRKRHSLSKKSGSRAYDLKTKKPRRF